MDDNNLVNKIALARNVLKKAIHENRSAVMKLVKFEQCKWNAKIVDQSQRVYAARQALSQAWDRLRELLEK